MSTNLTIDQSTCIRCGRCVAVCPSWIFTQPKPKDHIIVESLERCIACGHCVGVCPTGSVKNSHFPQGTVHKYNVSDLPSPQQVMLLCQTRRSNRSFKPDPVPENYLDSILEAAHMAPTASNKQQVEFTLVTDPQKIDLIIDTTIDVFASMAGRLRNPFIKPILKLMMPGVYNMLPHFDRLVSQRAKGNDLILRNAKAVIFISTPKESRFGSADANLAYQNGSLMAESLGVSQFYTGFVCTAIKMDKKNRIKSALGIEGHVHAGMGLGMPEFRFTNYFDKEKIKVKKF